MARKELVFPEGKTQPSLFSAKEGEYPTQTRASIDETVGGEYRGYYKNATSEYWRPKSSRYKGRTGSDGNPTHSGIDVYAPYYQFPRETPIRAPIAGQLTFRYDATQTERLGNRAVITTSLDGKTIQLLFGHLARFHGRGGRKVEKGEIVGFAGCSGNADTQGECSEVGKANVNSGHVHLTALVITRASKTANAIVSRVDPAPLLRWSVRFADDNKRRKIEQWLEDGGLQSPIPRAGVNGPLQGGVRREWRRSKGRRRPLPAPFDTLEFDSTRSIRWTREAYELIGQRLGDDDFADHRKKAIAEYARVPAQIAKRMAAFDEEKAKLETATEIGGPLLRALMLALQAQWMLMGGSALAQANTNRGLSDSLVKKRGAERIVDCGISVGGEAWILAVDAGQCTLHYAHLEVASKRKLVYSVSFGAGSLWHATVPETAAEALPDGPARDYLRGLRKPASRLWRAIGRSQALRRRLNDGAKRAEALVILKKELAALRSALVDAAKYLDVSGLATDQEKRKREKEIGEILVELAGENHKVFEIADARSIEKEGKTPIGPRLSFLRLGKSAGGAE